MKTNIASRLRSIAIISLFVFGNAKLLLHDEEKDADVPILFDVTKQNKVLCADGKCKESWQKKAGNGHKPKEAGNGHKPKEAGNGHKPKEAANRHVTEWNPCFNHGGWCKIKLGFMTGLYRNDGQGHNDKIYLIEKAESRNAPGNLNGKRVCHDDNWQTCFDQKGWCKCRYGHYMDGLYRSGDDSWLHNIEKAKCCRPEKQDKRIYGHCYDQDVSSSFDHKGWSKCREGSYMTGIWRTNCKNLHCLEKFRCCGMCPTDGSKPFDSPWPINECECKKRYPPFCEGEGEEMTHRACGGVQGWWCENKKGHRGFMACEGTQDPKNSEWPHAKCECPKPNDWCDHEGAKTSYKTCGGAKGWWCEDKQGRSGFTPCERKTYESGWWGCFDGTGWCTVTHGYMTGLWRNNNGGHDNDGIERIEKAESMDPPGHLMGETDCQNANWWGCFDKKGWCKCDEGYYMQGMYRSGDRWLFNIEQAKCCRPKKQKKEWGDCYDQNIEKSFNNKGWSKCKQDYYMAGLWRGDCDRLYCIEYLFCCKMSSNDAFNWPKGKCENGMALSM